MVNLRDIAGEHRRRRNKRKCIIFQKHTGERASETQEDSEWEGERGRRVEKGGDTFREEENRHLTCSYTNKTILMTKQDLILCTHLSIP